MNVFDLQAKISLDSSEFEKNLSAAAGHMSGFGSTVEGIFKNIGNALAAAFAVDKVKDFVQGAVTEFARFEQLVGGVDALFGEAAGKTLQENADAAFQTAGLSANAYMDTATSFAASLIQALGGDTAAAVDMVDMAVTDMADNANRMGTDIGSIQHAYQGFAKQNYTMLDNLKLGYGGTKAEMARLINDTGILGDTIVELSTMTQKGNFEEVVSFDVVIEAIHQVQEEMNITGTTMAEASGTIEGSINTMKAAWSNWQAGLADPDADMTVLTDNLVSSFQTAADNVVPAVQRIGDSIGEVFTHITGIDLTPVTAVFDELKTSLTDIGAAFAEGGVGGGFEAITAQIETLTGLDLSGVTEGFAGISDTFADIGAAFESGGVAEGLTTIVETIGKAAGIDVSGVVDGIQGIAEAIGNAAQGFAAGDPVGAINMLVDTFAQATGIDLSGFVDGIWTVVDTIAEFAPQAAEKVQEIFGQIQELFTVYVEYVSAIWPIVQPMISGVFSAIGTLIQTTFDTISSVITGILDAISGGVDVITGVIGAVAAVLQGDFEAAASAIQSAWSGVLDFFGGIANGIMDAFKGLVSGMAGIGRDMWEGLKSGFSAAVDGIKGIGGKISDGFKSVFDINSPSRVFAEYGRFMAQGLEVGWDREMSSVRRTMSDGLVMHGKVDFANSALGRTTSAVMNGMMSSGGSSGGAMNINLNVDGRTMAQVMFDPLNNIIKQKGVTLGAQN
jgi:phage-related protein